MPRHAHDTGPRRLSKYNRLLRFLSLHYEWNSRFVRRDVIVRGRATSLGGNDQGRSGFPTSRKTTHTRLEIRNKTGTQNVRKYIPGSWEP